MDHKLTEMLNNIDQELYRQQLDHQNFSNKLDRRENWGRVNIRDIRRKSKRLGMDFDLIPDDLPVPKRCPILGIELIIGSKGFCDNSPSVDRIDNNKGYTKDNIHVISLRANRIKNNSTAKELRQIADYLDALDKITT